jgi:hypothetical protein
LLRPKVCHNMINFSLVAIDRYYILIVSELWFNVRGFLFVICF